MTTQQRQLGFSLVELLIVVGIIGVVSAIAIPNLIASRRSANEASAISTMRLLFSAQSTYRATAGSGSFGNFGALQTAGLIDSVVGGSDTTPKSGYVYTLTTPIGTVTQAFDCSSIPSSGSGLGATGTRSFAVNETGVLYFLAGGTAPAFSATTRAATTGAPLNN